MQERIKELAREAGGVPMRENCLDAEAFPWGVEMEIDALERFAQAVARECEAHVMQAAKENPVMGASACYGAAAAIRARFGLGE